MYDNTKIMIFFKHTKNDTKGEHRWRVSEERLLRRIFGPES